MLEIARRLLGELAWPQGDGAAADPAVALRAAADRALERVRRGRGPAPFTGDERVLLHAAALPVLRATQADPGPGVSESRLEQMVQAVALVVTSRFARRVERRLATAAATEGQAARDLAAAADVDMLRLAVRAATSTPRALTEDEDERALLDAFFAGSRPSPEILDALAGCYLERGDVAAAANVRTARALLFGGR